MKRKAPIAEFSDASSSKKSVRLEQNTALDATSSDRSVRSDEDISTENDSGSDSDSDESEGEDSDVGGDGQSLDRMQWLNDPQSSRLVVGDRLGRAAPKRDTPAQRAQPSPHVESFAALGISQPLQNALKSISIKVPTEIQRACIPPLLEGRDCVGNAKTGSGKTIAFALPILQKLSVDPYGIYALVLTPTRELAFQISEQFAILGGLMNVRTAVIVGGMDMMTQAIELGNRPHIVVATPGRVVDHLKSSNGEWDLSRVKFLVLDEADRLLTSTFAPELSFLFNVLPKERQTCLFTATMTASIEDISSAPPRQGKQLPFIHRMTESVETVSTLRQHYILVPSHVREPYLFYLLCNPPESTIHLRQAPPEPIKKRQRRDTKKTNDDSDNIQQPPPTIIFVRRPRTAAYLTLLLKFLNIRATALHSRITQRERLTSLSLFRSFVVPVLVSTDVGARGLDIEDVALVINWDMPEEPTEYTHRVGRTARAGRGGVAISFVTEKDEENVLKVEDRIKTKLEEMTLPEDKVLEKLNAVSTAKRLANMELHDTDFGKREKVHMMKRAVAAG
ncbi:DEAD box helicase family protein [Pleurotus pulmonarius]